MMINQPIPALEIIADATRLFERRFGMVEMSDEGPFVNEKNIPRESTSTRHRFITYACGLIWPEGEYIPDGGFFPTADEAAQAFAKNMGAIPVSRGDILIWRKSPQLRNYNDRERKTETFTVRCRFAIINADVAERARIAADAASGIYTIETELPDPVTIRMVYGDDATTTDNMIISDQLGRIEVLLMKLLAEMQRGK